MAAPLPLEEAQSRLLALAKPLQQERVPVGEALGRYLIEPLVARRQQPAADVSAMDGYALRSADLPGPWTVIGESAAGHPFSGALVARQAVRVSTGAVVPDGADLVLIQEDCRREGATLHLESPGTSNRAGGHIRQVGNDFALGRELLRPGQRIGSAQVALALTAGHRLLAVRRQPKIAILDCGDELAADPTDCQPHQVPASNGAMLAALIQDAMPCLIERIGPLPDRLDALQNALDQAASADVIVTSGGASVGDHDLIRPTLEQWGAQLDFWKVAIKPGKPLLVATRGSQLVIGLPGNPVSSMVTAYLFLLPLLRAMLGSDRPLPGQFLVPLAQPLASGGDRREFLRAHWDGAAVSVTVNQDSAALAALARSNALIDRPAQCAAAPAGTPVPVFLLQNGGIA